MPAMPPDEADRPVERLYARQAREYDRRWSRYVGRSLDRVLAACRFAGHETVLDAPCGTGELARRLLSRWPRLQVHGVDICGEMLGIAAEKLGGDAFLEVASAEALPYPDASFDGVLCANSFHYFRRGDRALAEFRRVLRPGGGLLLLDWCDDYWTCKICGLWLRLAHRAFHRAYTIQECRRQAEAAGFRVAHSERFRIDWLWGMMLLHGV